jgi:hypothetical protein
MSKKYVTKKELELYSLLVSQWMQDQILLNYDLGRRISALEQKQK